MNMKHDVYVYIYIYVCVCLVTQSKQRIDKSESISEDQFMFSNAPVDQQFQQEHLVLVVLVRYIMI